jgi:poly(3-hydroxyalkanoate) depolymerase
VNIQTVVLGNQTIRVCIKTGKAGTIPLLCFNGIGAGLELLTPFVEALHESNPDLEIITFDSIGVGGSSTPSLPYRFSSLAKVVSQMLDALNYGQVDVLGLSWGGMSATQFVYDFPYRVNKLILCATATGITSAPPSFEVLSLMASPRRYSDPNFMAEIAPTIYGGAFKTNPTLAAEYAQKMVDSKEENKETAGGSTLGYLYQTTALYWWTSLYMLPCIKQSTLLVAGSDDPIIRLCNMEIMNKLIPDSTLHVIPNGGHLFLLTHLDVVTPMITKFLEEANDRSSASENK